MNKKVMAVINKVLSDHLLHRDDFFGRCRSSHLVEARADAARQLRDLGYSYPQIGRFLRREHTTIVNYLDPATRIRKQTRYANIRALRLLDAVAKEVVLEIAKLERTSPEVIIAQWVNERADHEAKVKRELISFPEQVAA